MPDTIQYSFDLVGGRSNHDIKLITAAPIALQAIRITSNAKIDNPWQQFGQYWKDAKIEQQGNLYVYTLSFLQPVNIPAGTTDILEYSVSTALGPITNVAMPPVTFEIQQPGQKWETITSVNAANSKANPHPDTKFTVYTTNWGEYSYKLDADNLDYDSTNDVAYGFIGFDINGNVKSLDSWGDQLGLPKLALKKQQYPNLTTAIAFGGWTNAGQRMDTVFSAMAADTSARANFVKNAVTAAIQAQANGIDIDWEYPEAKDAANYLALLKELRAELSKQIGPQARLTIAAPAGKDKIDALTAAQWQELASNVDLIKIMTYDYFGAFSDTADFHSAKKLAPQSPHVNTGYCIDDTLKFYAQNGVAKNKLSVGFPNYTRAMIVAQSGDYAGLYQPVLGAPKGEFGQDGGVYSWNAIYNVLNHQPSELDQLGVKQWQFYDSSHPFCKDANMCMLTGQLPDGRWVTMNFLDRKTAAQRAQEYKAAGYNVMLWADYEETLYPANRITKAISDGLDGKVNQYQMAASDESVKQKAIESVTRLQQPFWKPERATTKQDALRQIAKVQTPKEAAYLLAEQEEKLSKYRNPIMRALAHTLFGKHLKEPQSLTDARILASKPTKILNGSIPKPKI